MIAIIHVYRAKVGSIPTLTVDKLSKTVTILTTVFTGT